jgi:GTP-binding protein HflX
VQLRLSGRIEQEELDELRLLAESAGAEVCGAITGSRQVPDAATFIGNVARRR